MSIRMTILASAIATLLLAPMVYAAPPAAPAATATTAPAGAPQFPAVALSWDGQHLAWVATQGGKAELMLASWTGKGAHAVAIPGACAATGLRWQSHWNRLAVVTTCAAVDHRSSHSAIWVVDVHSGAAPRRVASLAGVANDVQWSRNGKAIGFLYTPAPASGASGANQVIAAVPVAGGPLQIVTPATWNVHAFQLSRMGNATAFTATPDTAHGAAPNLYLQAGTKPELLFDPASATGALHGLQVSLPRFGVNGNRVYFLGRKAGSTASDICSVKLSNHALVDMTASLSRKPAWFTVLFRGMNHGEIVGTESNGRATQVVGYRQHDAMLIAVNSRFSLPGTIGNGNAPSGASFAGYGVKMAFAQRTPDGSLRIRAGNAFNQPPPVVASASTEVASTTR